MKEEGVERSMREGSYHRAKAAMCSQTADALVLPLALLIGASEIARNKEYTHKVFSGCLGLLYT
jgi:hypothetical protein